MSLSKIGPLELLLDITEFLRIISRKEIKPLIYFENRQHFSRIYFQMLQRKISSDQKLKEYQEYVAGRPL